MNRFLEKSARNTKTLVFTIVTLVVFVVLLGLGTWQVQRLQWKEALIASIQDRVASAPQSLGDIEQRLSDTGDVDYWPMQVRGVFEHDHEQHFFATHKGYTGYYIYTPLKLDDQRMLFINRGFVPFDQKQPSVRGDGQITGMVTISGLARNRLSEKPSWVVPDNDLAQNIHYWKDLSAMTKQSGYEIDDVVQMFMDADDATNPGGLPIGGVTLIDLPNNHLQYAITWYGLAVALAGVFGFWFWRREKTDGTIDNA